MSLNKGKKSKLGAVALPGCKSNKELSWISHVKIINHCMGSKNTQKGKQYLCHDPILNLELLKNTFSFSNLTEILPHFVLQLSCYS